MSRTACTEPQCLYKGALYLFITPSSFSGWSSILLIDNNDFMDDLYNSLAEFTWRNWALCRTSVEYSAERESSLKAVDFTWLFDQSGTTSSFAPPSRPKLCLLYIGHCDTHTHTHAHTHSFLLKSMSSLTVFYVELRVELLCPIVPRNCSRLEVTGRLRCLRSDPLMQRWDGTRHAFVISSRIFYYSPLNME